MNPTPEQIEAAARAEEDARKQEEGNAFSCDGVGDVIADAAELGVVVPEILSVAGDVAGAVASGIGDVVGGILGGIGDVFGSL